MTVNETTLEKTMQSLTINLQQAYMVTKRMNEKDAKKVTAKFINDKLVKDLLDFDINKGIENTIIAIREKVREYIMVYKGKKDKSYTALLKLEEYLS